MRTSSSSVSCLLAALLLAVGCARHPQGPAGGGDTPGTPSSLQDSNAAGGEQAAAAGRAVWLVRNSGVRCVAAPCPTYLARKADAPEDADALQVHELDLSALGLSEERQAELLEETTRRELRVEAWVSVTPDAGPAGAATVLHVTQLL